MTETRNKDLTPTEKLVLKHLPLSNKEIGARLQIPSRTVEKHVEEILRKLQAANRTTAVVFAICDGLVNPKHFMVEFAEGAQE